MISYPIHSGKNLFLLLSSETGKTSLNSTEKEFLFNVIFYSWKNFLKEIICCSAGNKYFYQTESVHYVKIQNTMVVFMMLGTFLKAFPKRQLPVGIFRNVKFPNRQLHKSVLAAVLGPIAGSSISTRTRDKRVTEINWNLWYMIFSTAGSIVYKYCTRPICRHLYSGIFKDYKDYRVNSLILCFMLKIWVFL